MSTSVKLEDEEDDIIVDVEELFPDQLPFDEHLPYEMMKLMELGFTEQISQLIFAKPQQINIWLTEIHKQRLGTGVALCEHSL